MTGFNMQLLGGIFRKFLVSYLCCYLVFSPLFVYGAPLVADGTTQTVIDKARNNVPVVQIADPNASGLSHNKFTHYNVNKSGLILNNAKTTTVKTQLGGFIYGNTQLTNNAKVILNEVTSTNRSALNGYTEVAGPRSDLVIANPNGLTINGAGFINTNNVTLTTGRPRIANGALNSLNVTGGDILIDGAGLNTQGQLNTHIYTQYLKLNAKLHGQNLDLKLGNNTVNYQSKAITASGAASNPRALSLDASALGGMYANRIALVGTDKGLGVNLPPEVLASAGDITITNDGNIALHKLSATQQVNVQTANNITADNNVYSGTNVTLNAGNAVAINAGVTAAKSSVTINAAQLNNGATIMAGLNANNSQNTTGVVAITANTVSNSGQLQSTGNLGITAANTLSNVNGRITAAGDATIQTVAVDNSNGKIDAGRNLTLNTKTATLNNSGIYAGNDAAVTLDVLDNVATSAIGAGRHLAVSAVNGITNRSDLLANGNVSLNTNGVLLNQKTISSGGALLINANTLDNAATGTISGGTGISQLNITGNINNQSRISAAGDLQASGTNITNNGFFNAGNNLTLSSTNLSNNQTLFAGNNMNLYTTGVLSNNPNANIFAMNNLVMAANAANGKTTRITNDRANIEAYNGNMNVFTARLENITNPPVLQGTYVAATPAVAAVPDRIIPNPRGRGSIIIPGTPARAAVPEYIAGGVTISNTTKTVACGFNCRNVINTKVDQVKLLSNSPPATMNAGANMVLEATNIKNQYSLISAGGDIRLAAQVVDNTPVDIAEVTTVTTALYRNQRFCKRFNFFGVCLGGFGNRSVYAGTTVSPNTRIAKTISSTIQAGGNILGHAANLTNGNIRQNQVIAATTTQTGNTATVVNTTTLAPLQLPVGTNGLFVVSQNPQGQFLIETNPAFAVYGNFISSSYFLQRISFSPDRTLKRVGDAFYENKLIRDSIFAQTGRRFLNKALNSDYAQYQYLMDNALKAQADLQLVPGLTLTNAQIAMLHEDIVWLEEQMVAGQQVLVPVVYIADVEDYNVEGGKIIAGEDVDLVVAKLENSGLLEAGNDIKIDAEDSILNSVGSIRAGEGISLLAQNDIENISANIKGKNIILASADGSIINKRYSKDILYQGGDFRDANTMIGAAGNIEATETLSIDAAKTIAITGSKLKANTIDLNAEAVEITTTVKKADFFAGGGKDYIKEQSVKHFGSEIEGGDVAIHSSGKTTIEGSQVHATGDLNIQAEAIDILAVNDSSYSEQKSSSGDVLSKRSTTTKKARSTNVASNVSGGNVTLSTINDLESTASGGDDVNPLGDINVIGSNVSAKERLALESAGDINVQAGFDGTMDETQTKKSGWFSGGKLFSKSEDLEGKLTKTAALANLSGGDVSLNAKHDIAMVGVNVVAENTLEGTAENISVENANNEEKTYSKHEKLTVSMGDALKTITQPHKLVKHKDGKLSVTLAKAEYEKADKVTTKTTVVSSNLEAGNIHLTAGSGEGLDDTRHSETDEGGEHGDEYGDDDLADDRDKSKGNINIKGSNLVAENDIDLTAENDVNIVEAKDTEKTASKEVKGKAELKVTVKNEYVQIAFAVKAAKEAKDNLQKAKSSYSQYKRDLATQRGKLLKLKADFVNGKIGIEQVDIEEFEELIDDLKQDDAFYKANIALATVDLATKTLAVVSQMSAASSASWAYGFSASLELDIDVLEKKFEAYKERSVASNLVASDINITSGATTTVRGSQLNAKEEINIDSDELNILASQDINNSKESSDHKHLNISVGTSGATSGSVSMDRSKGSSDGVTSTNSQLRGNNINIVTEETTTIAGANVAANDELNIKTEHLKVASVQDSDNSRSQSSGFSLSGGSEGISGAGVNAGNSRFRAKETVLTTLTGNSVNIDVEEDTTIRGALIAAVDKNGDDNGNLRLSTDTLEVGSLNNRRDSKSMSMGINVGISNSGSDTLEVGSPNNRGNSNSEQKDGSTDSSISSVGIDYSNDRSNSKTKTLGTIGNGRIEVGNVEKSNTKLLNRDINDNEVDIYNIESHQGLKGTVDTRVFTEDGRNAIAEDFERTERLGKAIGDVASKDAFELKDTFAHIDEVQKDLDVQKAFALENDGKNIEALQGENSTIEEKQAAIKLYAEIYAKTYGVDIESANIIAASKVIGGTHYGKGGKSTIDINDNAQRNATDYANTMGHEVAHARVSQGKARDRKNEKLNEEYADTMGGYSADGMAFSSETYNNVNLDQNADSNTHVRTAKDQTLLAKNNKDWRANLKRARNGDGEVDYLLPEVVKEWRDNLNQTMDENRQISADLKGDAVGTALSIAAAPADVLVDLANVLITTVDVSTDGLGSTGVLGEDLQAEALQNLSDMGVKIDSLIENREAIAASIVKTLEEYPERIADLDPSALRSLTAIVGEAAMPVAAIAKMNKVAKVDVPQSSAHNAADALRYKTELSLKDRNILTNDGKLTRQAINDADKVQLKDGVIKNPAVVKELIKDGSNISDWAKYSTQSVDGPSGSRIQVHFYMNKKTGKIDYNTPDFKVKNPVPAIPKASLSEPKVPPKG